MTDPVGDVIRLRSMKERRYAHIPIEQLAVINSRERDQRQFQDNVHSIETVGLLKPILVNDFYLEKTGKYELVCGEGRLLAHKKSGKVEIEAEIITVDRKRAHLMSLIENMARMPPGIMWFAREILRMKNTGMTVAQIALIQGRSETYVNSYINLAERGEERLIRGVEQGVFSIGFAHRIADAGGADIQNILMDAFDANIITSSNFTQVKRIVSARIAQSRAPEATGGHRHANYTVDQLKRDISRVTREKQSYVKEAAQKENRLFALIGALETLMKSNEFTDLLKSEGLQDRPQLAGAYGGIASGTEPNNDKLTQEGAQHVEDIGN